MLFDDHAGLDSSTQRAYIDLLEYELECALGCTEPIALAYAGALAVRFLGEPFTKLEVVCSGNIVKNVKSVAVPNAEGLKGIEVACILGAVAGDADARLEVLKSVTHADVERTRELLSQGICAVDLAKDVPNLYVSCTARGETRTATIEIEERHTNVTRILANGIPLDQAAIHAVCPTVSEGETEGSGREERVVATAQQLTMSSICAFAHSVDIEAVRTLLERQATYNMAIAEEGLRGHWGSQIGRTLVASQPLDIVARMRAYAAAGSDARMGGCSLPVVINSGSGNQGICASVPVVIYARAIHASDEQLLRALCISNLTAIHLKHYIGSLSAFCGVVCAAAGAGAAITYLAGGDDSKIGATVVNTIANVGGIMCDGAKASCAAKIASSVDAAMLAHTMAMLDEDFCAGDGLVASDVETSIMSMGYVGRVGMKSTDVEIIKIMLGQTGPEDMRC
ncbi:MAG: serine dehydratase subunit alpha family protein [Coriobacteriales bacterium]|nr:serine dehydratase subunit alpha family protein [Coriobacteriales bacterium]